MSSGTSVGIAAARADWMSSQKQPTMSPTAPPMSDMRMSVETKTATCEKSKVKPTSA